MDMSQTLAKVQALIDKLAAVAPQHWKGNDAPNPHHFDAGSIVVSGGLLIDAQKAWLQFAFTDGGTAHKIKATFAVTQPGTQGGTDEIVLDDVSQANADFVLSHREGFENWNFYVRTICEFKFTDPTGASHRYRFDGDVA